MKAWVQVWGRSGMPKKIGGGVTRDGFRVKWPNL